MTKLQRNGLINRITAVLLTAVLIVFGTSAWLPDSKNIASAATTQELKDKISEYKDKISEAEGKIDGLKGDINKTSEYITALDAQIADYQGQIDALQEIIDSLQKEIDELQSQIDAKNVEIARLNQQIDDNLAKIADLESQIEDAKNELKNQIRSIYMNGETSSLEILLCADDFSDFLIKEQYVSSLASYEQALIDEIRGTVEKINAINEEIKAQTAEINKAKQEIESQQSVIQLKQNDVQEQQNEKDAVQATIEAKRSEAAAQLAKLKSSAAQYKDAIEQYQSDIEDFEAEIRRKAAQSGSTGNGSSSGGLMWPLQANCYISSYMTGRVNPITGYAENHGGIDICAYGGTYGLPISAAAGGTVITASYHYSYGNYVMVDHGNGLSTLYAHCSSLAVYEGQQVSKGQTIAYVGSSGYASGPHLHFEVRVNGYRVNPLGYVSM